MTGGSRNRLREPTRRKSTDFPIRSCQGILVTSVNTCAEHKDKENQQETGSTICHKRFSVTTSEVKLHPMTGMGTLTESQWPESTGHIFVPMTDKESDHISDVTQTLVTQLTLAVWPSVRSGAASPHEKP